MEGWNDLTTRLNRRARLAKRLLEGADRALGSEAAHVWKALRITVVAAGQRVYVYVSRLD
jgi:predicted Zn-dependent protease